MLLIGKRHAESIGSTRCDLQSNVGFFSGRWRFPRKSTARELRKTLDGSTVA